MADSRRVDQTEKQHERGRLTARERIDLIVDNKSFDERGALTFASERTREGLGESDLASFRAGTAGDGVVTGFAAIDGRPVSIGVFDATVLWGSNGEFGAEKLNRQGQLAAEGRFPFIVCFDGAGHRVQEGLEAWTFESGAGILPVELSLSGWAPMVAAIMGPVFGGTVNFAALMDLVIMVESVGSAALAGPALVRAATGQDLTKEELGGPQIQADETGLVDLVVPDEQTCARAIREFLSYLPANSASPPPHEEQWRPPDPIPGGVASLVPQSPRRPYDMRKLIAAVFDSDSLFEIQPTFGQNAVTTFARLEAQPVGIIANQPMHLAGTPEVKPCEKMSHFLALCDA